MIAAVKGHDCQASDAPCPRCGAWLPNEMGVWGPETEEARVDGVEGDWEVHHCADCGAVNIGKGPSECQACALERVIKDNERLAVALASAQRKARNRRAELRKEDRKRRAVREYMREALLIAGLDVKAARERAEKAGRDEARAERDALAAQLITATGAAPK
jgi:hypothetical protein